MIESLAPLTVINLFGAPGVGKSTVASHLFYLMKRQHLSVEMVSEYAKYLLAANRKGQLEDEQLYILAKQHHKQHVLVGKFRYAISDSPLLLSSFYRSPGYPASFDQLCLDFFRRFDNRCYFLVRPDLGEQFEAEGRRHDARAALEIQQRMQEWLAAQGVAYRVIENDDQAALTIFREIQAVH